MSAGTFAVRCCSRSPPDVVHEDPQELGGRGGGGQRAGSKAAQEDGVFFLMSRKAQHKRLPPILDRIGENLADDKSAEFDIRQCGLSAAR